MTDGLCTRREILRGVAATTVGVAGLPLLSACQEGLAADGAAAAKARMAPTNARVVLVRNPGVFAGGKHPVPDVAGKMLDDGIMALFGTNKASEAWAKVGHASDTVGIKSNAWRFLRTPQVFEEALQRRMRDVGVAAERISVDDRGIRDNPVFQSATALINIRPMRTHHWAGVGSCIKNYIMFTPEPSAWHDDSCANLAGVWDLPAVAGKTRLNVLVMLTPLFHGKGPHHYQSKYVWKYDGLILGTDPVAVDATGLRILQAMRARHFGADQPFAVSPKHITVAESKYRLGVADPSRIEVVRVGSMDGALI